VSKNKFPKGTASANSSGFDVWRSWAQNTFLFLEATVSAKLALIVGPVRVLSVVMFL